MHDSSRNRATGEHATSMRERNGIPIEGQHTAARGESICDAAAVTGAANGRVNQGLARLRVEQLDHFVDQDWPVHIVDVPLMACCQEPPLEFR